LPKAVVFIERVLISLRRLMRFLLILLRFSLRRCFRLLQHAAALALPAQIVRSMFFDAASPAMPP